MATLINSKTIKILILVIIFLNILLRLPSLFEPYWYGDECIYLTLGQAFNKGLVFYRDIHDNKPPLLYLVAALANGKLFWFRFITIVWNTINIWLIFKLAKQLTKNNMWGLGAAFLFLLFSLLPEGRITNGEIYMIMPATLGVLLALRAITKKQDRFWFLSGLAFSIAFLFKIPVIFDFAGLVLALLVFSKKKISEFMLIFKDKKLYLLIAGFLLPIILSIIYYSVKGAFTPYVRSALMQNMGYLSSWGGSKFGLYIRFGLLLTVNCFIFIWRKKLTPAFYLPALLCLWGLFGVFLSERPYPHYLIEAAPWLALLLIVLVQQKRTKQFIITLVIVGLGLAGVIKYKYWWYPNLPYYQNFIKFVSGKINKEQYFSFFGNKVLNDYQLAKTIQFNTKEDERIFIWGDGVCIYSLARRLPPGRYTINYHIYDFNGFTETAEAIKKWQPNFITILPTNQAIFPQLQSLLTNFYFPWQPINQSIIYHKIIAY